jgi:hypothetical protein
MRRALRTAILLLLPTTLVASCGSEATISSPGGSGTTSAEGGRGGEGPCTEGALGCAGHTPQTCMSGQWVLSETTCAGLTPSCLDGACVACSPGTKDCGASTPRTCDEKGAWQYGAPCAGEAPVCLAGACVACSPGDVACRGVGVETCGDDGAWKPTTACQFGCSNAMCTGICVPSATRCNGDTPEVCDTAGTWQAGETCTGAKPLCLDGLCVQCSPGSVQCDGNVRQSCDESGALHDEETCPFTCSNGACSGLCVPGDKQCNGKTAQTCKDDGTWADVEACLYVCSEGECTGQCSPGSVTCLSPSSPGTCDANGAWQSPGACPQPTPDCVQGSCTCAVGHTTCGNECVDLKTNNLNCGACGHSCDGGACVAGVCQGVVLAAAQNRPIGLALGGGYLYFTSANAGTVSRVPVTGGQVELVATGQSGPQGVAVDASHVYWTNPGGSNTVMRADITGAVPATPVIMATGQAGPLSIAVDATHAYWTSTSGLLSKTPIDATSAMAPTVLCSGALQGADISTPIGLAIDGTYAYFTNGFFGLSSATIVRVPLANTATSLCEVMVRGQTRPTGLAVDGSNLYWTNWAAAGTDTVSSCPKGAYCNTPTVLASLQQISSIASNLQQIASDGTHVFWPNGSENKVMKVPVAGGAVKALYASQTAPTAVVVDAQHVYWTTNTSVVRGVKDP